MEQTTWIFIIIVIFGIVFILYKTFTKQKHESKQRQTREKEVKKTIKKHLQIQKLTNVAIEYVKVNLREGKKYQKRDIYDVFVKVMNPKSKKIIAKKAFEIEGFARLKENSEDKNDYIVDWVVNKEFDYQKHWTLIIDKYRKTIWGIYFRALFKRNRSQYIKKEKEKYYNFQTKIKKIDHQVLDLVETKEVFRPELKKDQNE